MRHSNRESIEDFGEDDMPCPCQVCGGWFDLNDGKSNPRKENLVICAACADDIQKEVDREEEIEDLNNAISDAEYTIKDARKQLNKLGVPDSGEKVESQTIEQYFRDCYGTDDPRTMKFDGRDMMDFAEAWAVKEANDLQKENSDLRAQLGRVNKGELRLEALKKRLIHAVNDRAYIKGGFSVEAVLQIIEEEIKVKPRHKD